MKDLSQDSGEGFLQHLDDIALCDAAGLKMAYKSYGPSWKSRGGVGAFMMLARKWDRLENRLKVQQSFSEQLSPAKHSLSGNLLQSSEYLTVTAPPYDIFAHIEVDQRPEGVIDDVRDLRRYLMLVEAEMLARGLDGGTHRDNQPGEGDEEVHNDADTAQQDH